MRSFGTCTALAVITFFTLADALHVRSAPYSNSTKIKCTKTRTKSKTNTVHHVVTLTTGSEPADPTAHSDYTTSTVYTTKVNTITSCAPTVTNCPVGSVTTETIALYTTVCPITATESKEASKSSKTEAPSTSLTTSTVYSTKVNTVTSCTPEVTNCPIGKVITETIPLYTTICPVTSSKAESTIESKTESKAESKTESITYPPSSKSMPSLSKIPEYTISTAYTTKVVTVISCAPEVTKCPAESTVVITQTSALYTTVCPVTTAVSETKPVTKSEPTTTLSSTYTQLVSITVYSISSKTTITQTASQNTQYVTVSYEKNYSKNSSSTSTKTSSQIVTKITSIATVVPVYSKTQNLAPSSVAQGTGSATVPTTAVSTPSAPLQVTGAADTIVASHGLALVVFVGFLAVGI